MLKVYHKNNTIAGSPNANAAAKAITVTPVASRRPSEGAPDNDSVQPSPQVKHRDQQRSNENIHGRSPARSYFLSIQSSDHAVPSRGSHLSDPRQRATTTVPSAGSEQRNQIKHFQEDVVARISSVRRCGVPDFGLKFQTSLFDQLNSQGIGLGGGWNEGAGGLGIEGEPHLARRPSLWMLFLDAIQRFPKFQRLKNIIEEANAERDSLEQQEKRAALQRFLQSKIQADERGKGSDALLKGARKPKRTCKQEASKRTDQKRNSVQPGKKDVVTFQVEEILRDKEQLKSIQKMMEENDRMASKSISNMKLQKSKEIMQNIFRMQHTCQREHDALKKAMRYKLPKEKLQLKLAKWKEQVELGAVE